MKKTINKILATALAVSMCISGFSNISLTTVYAEEVATKTISVDINGSENRTALKSPEFEDWTLTGNVAPTSINIDGVDFTLSTTTGENFLKSEQKTLVVGEYTPYLTADGAFIKTEGAGIVLEISGLAPGTHTIATWHSYHGVSSYAAGTVGKLGIYINGEEKATVTPTFQVKDDNLAGISYVEFEAKEGETVKITIQKASDSEGYDFPILNAFEVDGAHPIYSIKDAYPEHNEGHFNPEEALSWTAGEGAVAHDVYFGTDEYTVKSATTESPEYKGRQTETTYQITDELSHMSDYYWRVDEIDENGNVVTGKVYRFQIRHLAFPTAEGYGRFAKGGRGGYVYEVTTLEDTGEEGSLRYGVETLKGARIIVFKVGGVIELKSRLMFPNDGGNVYVAGQTAPGDGITLINYDFGAMGSEDIIIRNVRVRVGDMNGESTGGMGLASCDNCIIDHCSISWATDEGFSSRSAFNITFQNNIIGESLHDSVHYRPGDDDPASRPEDSTEPHAFAASISGNIGSFHHNLLINCTGRNWSLAGGLESDGSPAGYLDISNNVVYNWHNRTNDGGVLMLNLVNNYYKMGWQSKDMTIANLDTQTITYASGNMMVSKTGSVMLSSEQDGWEAGRIKHVGDTVLTELMKYEPLYPNYITLESAEDAYTTTLNRAGARVPSLDYIDSRYIDETTNGTYTYRGSKQSLYGIIDSQEDAGGYPNETNFKGGEAPVDTDHDGMPDEWETKNGLNPEDANDGSIITLSAEGYTNVEMYLNELMGDPLMWTDPDHRPTATPEVTNTPEPVNTPEVSDTPAPEFLLGDVDENGVIEAADALAVLKHAAKLDTLEGIPLLAADVTKEGEIDASDALDILKYAAKLIESF